MNVLGAVSSVLGGLVAIAGMVLYLASRSRMADIAGEYGVSSKDIVKILAQFSDDEERRLALTALLGKGVAPELARKFTVDTKELGNHRIALVLVVGVLLFGVGLLILAHDGGEDDQPTTVVSDAGVPARTLEDSGVSDAGAARTEAEERVLELRESVRVLLGPLRGIRDRASKVRLLAEAPDLVRAFEATREDQMSVTYRVMRWEYLGYAAFMTAAAGDVERTRMAFLDKAEQATVSAEELFVWLSSRRPQDAIALERDHDIGRIFYVRAMTLALMLSLSDDAGVRCRLKAAVDRIPSALEDLHSVEHDQWISPHLESLEAVECD